MSEVINKMIDKGEFIAINNTYQYSADKNITNLTIQISLMLSGNNNFFGFPISKKNKILFINTNGNANDVFEKMIKQLNGSHNKENYQNIKVLDLDLTMLINEQGITDLTESIDKEDFDIIIWNNVNILNDFISNHLKRIKSEENPIDKSIFLIKRISGMKTKIISHLYNAILEKNEFNKINDLATASITLSHKNIVEGYNLIFANNNNKNKSIIKLNKNDIKEYFEISQIKVFLNDVLVNDQSFDNVNPFGF